MKKKEYSIVIGSKTITAEFNDLADQANGSVLLRCEDTVVLATAVIGKDDGRNPGFFNLTVDYLERFYASGEILGSRFVRREGRPTDTAILASRVIDRTLRPLFEHHIKNAVQVIVTVLAVGKADPVILAINAASIALHTSDIPWAGPVGAVHVGKHKDATGNISELQIDNYVPDNGKLETGEYTLDLTICGKDGELNMIEAMAFEENEDELGKAFDMASAEITKLENWQKEIAKEIGKPKKVIEKPVVSEKLVSFFKNEGEKPLWEALLRGAPKQEVYDLEDVWKEKFEETFKTELEADENLSGQARDYYHEQVDILVHKLALEENKRADGRAMDQVRGLYAQAGGMSPVLHGSGIFYRGETHVFSALTLAGPESVKLEEGMEVKGNKRFMHHYNFPPYSAGETGRVGGMNRRETGHGALAEKALVPIIPNKMDFPYTIRVVSESLASNGSTSQASICASTIALMDGGVPIKAPVAGIAMGLMLGGHHTMSGKDLPANEKKMYKILTDIQGPEDHHGDMDFKVAGTRNGITAIQLDIKVDGVPIYILKEALQDAKKARLQILDVIEKEIAKPRADISPNAPKILVHKINVSQIGLVIGSGGKTVNDIREKTGAEITIEDDGTVYVTGKNGAAEKALELIKTITKEWNIGDTAEAEIIKIIEVGAIGKLSEYAEGLIHVSEIANFRVNRVTDVLKEGMKVPVKVVRVDKEKGRLSLSIKAADPEFIKAPASQPSGILSAK